MQKLKSRESSGWLEYGEQMGEEGRGPSPECSGKPCTEVIPAGLPFKITPAAV